MSWITRAEAAADVAAIREVNLLAFGKNYEPDLVDALRADPSAWLPGLSIVATGTDGQVVGHVLLSRCTIGETPVLSLGPVAVLPAHQGQGVGSAVILAGLAEARRQGEHLVILVGHLDYYPRFGFRPAADFGIDGPISGPHLMVLPLDDHPVPAGTIRYPLTWDL